MASAKETNTSESANAFTLTQETFCRGSKLDNVEQRSLELCRTYLAGGWTEAQSVDDIEVSRVSGGITNQLYRVKLRKSGSSSGPTDVAIKFYMSKFMKLQHNSQNLERLDDIVLTSALSQLELIPRVLGVFEDGYIQEFVEHTHFGLEHQQNPSLVRQALQLLARIHHLEVPIPRNQSWPFDMIEQKLNFGYSLPQTSELIEKLNLTELQKQDIRQEFAQLSKVIQTIGSGKVFSHGDFCGSNLIISKADQRLMPIDFEYACYCGRGWDLAVLVSFWNIDPFDLAGVGLPPDEQLRQIVQYYIEANEQLDPGFSSRVGNSVENLVRETKLYLLVYFYYIMSFLVSTQESIIESRPFDRESNLSNLDKLFYKYLQTKQRLIDDGTIAI